MWLAGAALRGFRVKVAVGGLKCPKERGIRDEVGEARIGVGEVFKWSSNDG
jgi:hypothetical protein